MTHFLAGKRAKDLIEVGKRQGFEYRETDRAARHSFSIFQQAEERNIPENVLIGEMRGHAFSAFDFTYLEDLDAKRQQGNDRPWVPYESPAQFTCVVVDLGASVPSTILNPRARKRLFPTELELEVESSELSKLFQVWSGLPNMARWLIDSRFLDFLSNTRGKFAFELGEGGLLCIASDVRSQDLLGLIAMGIACADSLPPGLLKAFHRAEDAADPAPDDESELPSEAATASAAANQVTDLRDVREARDKLNAGRRTAVPGASAQPDATAPSAAVSTLPQPPAAEVWEAWLAQHADEVASWQDAAALPDWEAMSPQEREAELAELATLAEEGLITPDELAEAKRYLGA